MKKHFLSLLAVGVTALTMNATAAVVFEDTFESYADTAAFLAAYPITAGTDPQPALTESTGDGAMGSNKFVTMPAAPSTIRRARALDNPISMNDVISVTFSTYIRGANWGNTRSSLGLRDAGAGAAFYAQIGTNNGTADNKWATRLLGIPGLNGYYVLLNGPDRATNEWTKLSFTLSHSSMRFFINDVESTDDALVVTGPATTAIGTVNLGYGITTTQPFDVDNIVVETTDASVNDWNMY